MTDKPILVFDVNETLLDLRALEPVFARAFGDPRMLRRWFSELIIASQALSLSGSYVPFGELGAASLKKLGTVADVPIGEAELSELKEAVAAMPPYPEVEAALTQLRDAGCRLFTLTNNPLETAKDQLTRGGLLELFEDCFSIDGTVNLYKPAPQSYALVEQRLGAAPNALWLIACHDWDVLGAAARGWKAVMIERPGNARLPTGPQPDIVAGTLTKFAEQFLERQPC